jgi:hypothetical protein
MIDPRVLRTDDLLRYSKPGSPLEEALYDALKRAKEDNEPWEEIASEYECDTPQELRGLIEELDAEKRRFETLADEIGKERDALVIEVERLNEVIGDAE